MKPAREGTPLRPGMSALSVCLINPKFEPSFWGLDFVLPLLPGDKRCWNVTGALPALAALVPAGCDVRIVDENVEDINFEALRSFDVIGVTGMIVQRTRMCEILAALRDLPALVVVGGAYVSVAAEAFAGLCDVRFVGEAEETWPAFLRALMAGEPFADRYEQAERTDMRSVPCPRYDLLKADRYVMASLQFSRGCPFLCEFCDIITVFGRRPRTKTPAQMLAEFDAVRRAGFRLCFLVDDNFIGNKVEARLLLRAVIEWQREHRYPLQLTLEASLNLAEDPELIELMVEANVRQVFVGIESPRRASLVETRKLQNVRSDSLETRLQRIRDGGLVVTAGFIVGFDSDDADIFDEQYDFIQRSGIAHALVAILSPIPTTPLYDRLLAEGRLDFADPEVVFRPKLMSADALKHGHARLLDRLYEPEAYFARLFGGYRGSAAFRRRLSRQLAAIGGRPTRAARVRRFLGAARQAAALARALARAGYLRRLGGAYVAAWWRENRPLGAEALLFSVFVNTCVVHWHFFNIARRSGQAVFGTVPEPAQQRASPSPRIRTPRGAREARTPPPTAA